MMDAYECKQLSSLLSTQSWPNRNAAAVFTWTSLQDFAAALQSKSGVRIKDFTSHLMTKKEVKEEPEYAREHVRAKEHVWRFEHIRAPDRYYILLRSDTRRADYMQITIHFNAARYNALWQGVEIPQRLEHFIGCFAETLDKYDKLVHTIREKKKRAEKRTKIRTMDVRSLDLWLNTICESIKYPYCIVKGESKYVLSILFNTKAQVNFEIRIANFQDTLPDLAAAIARCLSTLERMPVPVLITNPKTSYRWKTNKNAN
ncbi:hypothetical protein ACYULU_01600 [Breznakiellaceae bacterium SP9]